VDSRLGGGGPPHLQRFSSNQRRLPGIPQPWRCARPRARSPQGDGRLRTHQPFAPWLSVPQIGAYAPRRWRTTASPAVPAQPAPVAWHTPALEMRSFPSAEPAGRRQTTHTPALSPLAQRPPRSALARLGGGGPPHLQRFPSNQRRLPGIPQPMLSAQHRMGRPACAEQRLRRGPRSAAVRRDLGAGRLAVGLRANGAGGADIAEMLAAHVP
jgi:hypothetical protein